MVDAKSQPVLNCAAALVALAVGALSAKALPPLLTPDHQCVCVSTCPIYEASSRATHTSAWANGVVPYEFAPTLSPEVAARVRFGMDTIESVANVSFIPRDGQSQYVVVRPSSSGNSATVGPSFGGSVNITTWASQATIVHELLHTLGFWHEQQRPDRDNYVTIHYENIEPGREHNFNLRSTASTYGPYDFDSVMHYSSDGFSKNGLNTISAKPAYAEYESLMGINEALSTGAEMSTLDIWGLIDVYGGDKPPFIFTLISPDTGSEYTTGDTVMLEWEPADLADDYRVEVRLFSFPVFAIVLEIVTTDSAYPLTFSEPGLYTWTVEARNAHGVTNAIPNVTNVVTVSDPCIADFDRDGEVGFNDLLAFLDALLAEEGGADLNEDGRYSFFDLVEYLFYFAMGC